MLNTRISDYIANHFDRLTPGWITILSGIAAHKEPSSNDALQAATTLAFQQETPSRGMFKCVRRALFELDMPDVTALSFASALTKNKMNPDALIQIMSQQELALSLDACNVLKQQHLKILLAHIEERRLLSLLWTSDISHLKDAMDMMLRIDNALPDSILIPKKLKSFDELHGRCLRLMPRITVPDFDLEQRADVLILDKKVLSDDFVIRVPKTHYDLVRLGESLSFCIGNGTYSNLVKNKKCSIVGVFRHGEPVYGIQFNRYEMLQAQGFGNNTSNKPSRALINELADLLLTKPKLPSDFLPITDSSFINGYFYDNKDLFLVMKNIVYSYIDVPHDVYEELLSSNRKGNYVNTRIKPVYECVKMGVIE